MSNLKFSQGLRDNALTGTTAIDAAFNSGFLKIYDGTQPTSANDAPGAGTLLATVDLPADAFGAVSNGVISLSGTWQETAAIAASTATWFRLETSTDGGGSSATDIRIDGDVTTVAVGTGDLELDSTVIAVSDDITINAFTITVPE